MKINKIFCIASTTVVLLTGCKKELDQQPTDTFSDANAFTTLVNVQNGTNSAYGRYGAYANDMYVNALLSDEAKLGANNSGQGALTYRFQYGSDGTTGGDVTGAYYSYYSLIDQVNRVLPQIDKVTLVPGEENRRNIVKGQLLALRAIGHFSLLEMYCDRYEASKPGVPVVVTSCVTCKPPRNTMGEVMAQIQKDLGDARSLMPAATMTTFTDTVMNSINIAAYQARIALFRRDYNAAITYASEVINSGVKNLATGTDFSNIWQDMNNFEVLFRIRYNTSTAIGGLWTTTGDAIYIAPSDKLVNSYAANDIRKSTYIANLGVGNFVNKFYTSSKGGRIVDMKAVRIAEMYLIRAEAYARTGNVGGGTTDLNMLRAARISGYTPQTFATAEELATAVLDERFKELAFEGFRFFDLKRNNLTMQRDAADANPAWQTLPSNSFRWVLPIPRDEIIANPNTVQNPGY